MEFNGCMLPDDLCYDEDMLVWMKFEGTEIRIGLTSIAEWLAGPDLSIKTKEKGSVIEPGKNLLLIDGRGYFGAVRLPFGVRVIDNNFIPPGAFRNSLSVYSTWITLVEPQEPGSVRCLSGNEAASRGEALVKQYGLHCFSIMPDTRMVEIGTECSVVTARLRETFGKSPSGFVIHLVSDDPTAPVEIFRISEELHLNIVEQRKEGDIFHFLLQKQ
jgi:glycine cleavage system H lipoate-binding protein/TusA-related sulfurtransferase